METRTTDAATADVAFLTRSAHRQTTLEALAERPRDRADLLELTGVSSSTLGRTLRRLEDRNWVVRRGGAYDVTPLGAFVASKLADLLDQLETVRELRDVWQLLESEARGLGVDMVTDATVTLAAPDDPYRPVNRFVSLLRASETFRFVGFERPLLEPCRDEVSRRIVDGMATEIADALRAGPTPPPPRRRDHRTHDERREGSSRSKRSGRSERSGRSGRSGRGRSPRPQSPSEDRSRRRRRSVRGRSRPSSGDSDRTGRDQTDRDHRRQQK